MSMQQIDVVNADGVRDLVFLDDGRVAGCASGKFCGPSGDGWMIGGVLYITIEVEAEVLITMEDTREMVQEAMKAFSTDAGVAPVSTDGDSVSPELEVAKEVMAEDAESLKELADSEREKVSVDATEVGSLESVLGEIPHSVQPEENASE